MKPITVTFDEDLLERLDADPAVQREGRSAVLRRVADEYLKQRREGAIAEAYRRAYAGGKGLGDEFEGWEREGIMPPE